MKIIIVLALVFIPLCLLLGWDAIALVVLLVVGLPFALSQAGK